MPYNKMQITGTAQERLDFARKPCQILWINETKINLNQNDGRKKYGERK